MISLFAVVVLSYLIGSFPTSILVSKYLRGIDIREFGSGNAGGTNVWRTLGWKAGIIVMLLDVAKGWVAAYYIAQFGYENGLISPLIVQILAGISSILGHVYPIFAKFKGGKGVGMAAGMLIAIYPLALLFCFSVFLLVAFSTKYVSLASILAAITLPISLYLIELYTEQPTPPTQFYFAVLVVFFIVFTHRSNIGRLLKGGENRFGSAKEN